jgi:hypothetical protein
MSNEKLHPLKLTAEQIELRDIAVQQIGELQTTLKRLDAITGKQADREVIGDIQSNLANHIELFSKWFGTSPIED